jgi:hypothetical protein
MALTAKDAGQVAVAEAREVQDDQRDDLGPTRHAVGEPQERFDPACQGANDRDGLPSRSMRLRIALYNPYLQASPR